MAYAVPYFLCIGARKSGTTWLYEYLDQHQYCALPPVKELNFFLSARLYGNDVQRKRYLNEKYIVYNKKGRTKKLQYDVIPTIPNQCTFSDALDWYKAILSNPLKRKSLSKDLFGLELFTGDISPLYQNLSIDRISSIKECFPNLRIIYIIRNPISRLWSDFNMMNENKLHYDLGNPRIDAITDAILSKVIRGAFVHRIQDDWRSIFKDQFKVFFFEELVQEPENFAKAICEFLQIEYYPGVAVSTDNPNPRKKMKMPMNIKLLFHDLLHEEVLKMHRDFNNEYTQAWVDSLEK